VSGDRRQCHGHVAACMAAWSIPHVPDMSSMPKAGGPLGHRKQRPAALLGGPSRCPAPGDGPHAEGRMLLRAAAQARWLARDLAAVDRARTPWVLITFHNPWRARRTLPCIDNCACGVWRISKGSLWGVQMVQPACPWDGPRGAVRHEREAGQYGVRRSVRRLHDALCCQPGAPWCHARVRPSRELSGLALPPGALRPVGRCSPAR